MVVPIYEVLTADEALLLAHRSLAKVPTDHYVFPRACLTPAKGQDGTEANLDHTSKAISELALFYRHEALRAMGAIQQDIKKMAKDMPLAQFKLGLVRNKAERTLELRGPVELGNPCYLVCSADAWEKPYGAEQVKLTKPQAREYRFKVKQCIQASINGILRMLPPDGIWLQSWFDHKRQGKPLALITAQNLAKEFLLEVAEDLRTNGVLAVHDAIVSSVDMPAQERQELLIGLVWPSLLSKQNIEVQRILEMGAV